VSGQKGMKDYPLLVRFQTVWMFLEEGKTKSQNEKNQDEQMELVRRLHGMRLTLFLS